MNIKQLCRSCQWLSMLDWLRVGETAENVMGHFYYATSGFHIKFLEMHLFGKPHS